MFPAIFSELARPTRLKLRNYAELQINFVEANKYTEKKVISMKWGCMVQCSSTL